MKRLSTVNDVLFVSVNPRTNKILNLQLFGFLGSQKLRFVIRNAFRGISRVLLLEEFALEIFLAIILSLFWVFSAFFLILQFLYFFEVPSKLKKTLEILGGYKIHFESMQKVVRFGGETVQSALLGAESGEAVPHLVARIVALLQIKLIVFSVLGEDLSDFFFGDFFG